MEWIYLLLLLLVLFLSERISTKMKGQKGGGGGGVILVLILLVVGAGVGFLLVGKKHPSHSPVTGALNPGTCGANFDCSGETTNTSARPSSTVTANTPGTAAECCELSCEAGYAINSSGTECVVNTGQGQCIANTDQTRGLWANVRCPAIKNRNDCVGDGSKQSKLHTIYNSVQDLKKFNVDRGLIPTYTPKKHDDEGGMVFSKE